MLAEVDAGPSGGGHNSPTDDDRGSVDDGENSSGAGGDSDLWGDLLEWNRPASALTRKSIS